MRALVIVALLALTGCADLLELQHQASRSPVPGPAQVRGSGTLYDPSECIGAVVNGVCHGSVMPAPGYHQTCYGQMIAGQCVGAQF